jgi:hypothetical protein
MSFQIKADAFQSPLILKILSTHLADTAGAPEHSLIDATPCGALALSIAAVCVLIAMQTTLVDFLSGRASA